jgi:protein-S-isoprenylcysteine O-methyltransferase Ste14
VSALNNRIPPPVVMLAVAAAMLGASAVLPSSSWPASVRAGVALVLFALAGVFGAPAVRAFLRAGTTINPVAIERASKLVTTGVYGVSRNPMYLSLTLLLVSLAAGLGKPLLLLGPLVFALFIDRFQIVPEERVMAQLFGPEYEAYRQRVRRWL